jgi:hypothetical protein
VAAASGNHPHFFPCLHKLMPISIHQVDMADQGKGDRATGLYIQQLVQGEHVYVVVAIHQQGYGGVVGVGLHGRTHGTASSATDSR